MNTGWMHRRLRMHRIPEEDKAMKEIYTAPEMEIIMFAAEDVITESIP